MHTSTIFPQLLLYSVPQPNDHGHTSDRYVTEINYERYGTSKHQQPSASTADIPPQTLPDTEDDGQPIFSELIVHHGRVGLDDLRNSKSFQPEGVGVWMIQTAEDFEHQSACAGPLLFAFDFMYGITFAICVVLTSNHSPLLS